MEILKKITLTLLGNIMVMYSFAQQKPLIIKDQGSFAIGGTVNTNPGVFDHIKRTPEGQTFHGDHAYVYYQIPDKSKKLPLAT